MDPDSLVHTILTQAAKLRGQGLLPVEMFDSQIRRLVREELEPRGLELSMRDLSDGRTRFLVKEKASGMVRDMFDWDLHGAS
jgi:hypothetical protein